MPRICVDVSDDVYARLQVLGRGDEQFAPAPVDAVVGELIDHAQQGVYRPGSWERPWVMQAFGDAWLAHLEPDDRVDRLSGDGRVIFQRPRHQRSS